MVSLTQVHLLADHVMVCRAWGHPVLPNPHCQQEESKCRAGMLSTLTAATSYCSRHHFHTRTLSPVELELGLCICLSCNSGLNLCIQPFLPQQPRSVLWRNIPAHFQICSFFQSRIFFSFLSNSDSISKAQMESLSFPITYTNHSQRHESLLYSNRNNTLCLNYSFRH